MGIGYDEAMRELRRSQDAMDCGSFHGRERTRLAQQRVDELRVTVTSMPELIVTRGDGVPLPDQAAAIAAFKQQACLKPGPGSDFTASLGAVRVDPAADAVKVRVVREALNAIADGDTANPGWWGALAERETDAVLLRLYLLLKA